MKKILFLDIDNTLYSGKTGKVPPSAITAVEQARANGSLVFLCTGRSRAEASRYLNYPVDGFIFSSGSRIEIGSLLLYDHPIQPKMVEEIAEMIRSCHMGVLLGGAKYAYLDDVCYSGVIHYFSRPDADEATKEKDMIENGMTHMENRIMDDPIYKMGASKSHSGSFEPLAEILPKPFRLIQTLSSPEADFGDISDGSIMKSDGIRRVVRYYGMSMEDAIGIGDSGNDIDMIKACGIGVAMGNAEEEVKQAADFITDDIDADGILHAFEALHVI